MRTTLNFDDHLPISAKHRAVEESVSLACVIENVLRESLAKPRAMRETIRLITASAGTRRPDAGCVLLRRTRGRNPTGRVNHEKRAPLICGRCADAHRCRMRGGGTLMLSRQLFVAKDGGLVAERYFHPR